MLVSGYTKILYGLIWSMLLLVSCKKDLPLKQASVNITLSCTFNTIPLVKDTFIYVSAANDTLMITRLQIYLSDFTFMNPNSQAKTFHTSHYFDAFTNSPLLSFAAKPEDTDSLGFTFGIPQSRNVKDSLPNNMENMLMIWPDVMGGGFHFLKCEGRVKTADGEKGFAIHLGTNLCSRLIKLKTPNHSNEYRLTLHLEKLFNQPNIYNFSIDPVYTMGDTLNMIKLADNMSHAFSIN